MTSLLMFCFFVITVVCDTSTEPEKKPVFPREFDFRFTSYQDLLTDTQAFKTFQHENLTGAIQLTVDIPRNQLLVGARDVILQLSLDDLNMLDSVSWMPDTSILTECSAIKKKEVCHNYVRVVMVHDDSVFTCGTYAANPKCSWRNAENLTVIEEDEFSAVGYLPFTPDHNSTAVLTRDRVYYSGTVSDVQGRNEIIFRPKTKDYRALLTKKTQKWLTDPHFVSAYEIDDYVYFFFREVAIEYINCGKRIYSRVARVCKNDQGTDLQQLLFKDNWTTFVKARLNCFLPGEYPFYFDQIQNTYLLDTGTEKFLFAIFTTSENSIAGSAVCYFNMTSFASVFSGPFKYQKYAGHAWERVANTKPAECPNNSGTDKRSSEDNGLKSSFQSVTEYQLMDDAVQPQSLNPLMFRSNERWTHIVVDVVKGKGHQYYVMFVATLEGNIRKMAYLPQTNSSCLIEEYRIVPEGEFKPVKNMRLSRKKGAVFVTVEGQITKIPVQRCERFTDQDLCKNSMDPYCGWNGALNKCTTAPDNDPSIHFWMQDIISCPIIEHPIDGGWSEWSPWATCKQMVPEPSAGDCLCRTRSCDNPKQAFGGKACEGATVEVTNCTAHGQWTDWTAWSKCSITCGHNGTRSRLRYCSNPPPRYGGRECIGSDKDVGYCPGNPTCPDPPIDGKWTMWAQWSRCTAECNGGIQTRKRQCNQPPPTEDGKPCEGNTQEWRMCNTLHCPELAQFTPWTIWIKTNETSSGYFQQRFRFMCEANVPDVNMIKTSYVKTHSRYCFKKGDGTCHRAESIINMTKDGHWSPWQPWSVCSNDCGGGTQTRIRSCDSPEPMGFGKDCYGHHMESRQCNMHSCQGIWSCWSEFSQCSASCGEGNRVRVRHCSSPVPGTKYKYPCKGLDSDYRQCDSKPCNMSAGWDHWSSWTHCHGDGLQYRHRKCLKDSHDDSECHGHKIEYSTCIFSPVKIGLTPVKSGERDIQNFTLFHLIVVSTGSFLFGIMITIGLYLCYKTCRSFRKFDLEKERKKSETWNNGKRKCGSLSSQISLDFLTINNKVYDASTLQLSKQDKFVASKNTYNSIKRKESLNIDYNHDV